MSHPITSNHPLLSNAGGWDPSEFVSPNHWSDIEMIKWMTWIQARADSLEDTSLGLLTDTASQTGGVFARLAALEAGTGSGRTEQFSSMPGFTPAVLTYPDVTANHSHDLSIVSGKLRATAVSTLTNNNLRTVWGHRSSGIMGDSEVRSTFTGAYSSSGVLQDLSTVETRYQWGHCHRMRRREQLLLGATAAAAVGASTIDITGTPWASSQWVGDEVGQRETWARIVSGPGQGLHRRIIDNDSNTLTVFPSWTANGGTIPTTSSKFEIYAFSVRGLSIVLGNVAGGGHGMIQPNIWDNVAYKQPDTGQIYVTDPTVLGNNYLHPAFAPYRSFPWYMKTKVVGNTASWAVWVQGDPETSYSDSTGRAGSWTLEAADDVGFVDEPGMAGLYVAHMNASEYVEWDAMTVTRL